jgi:hypothetical protein
MQKRRILFPQLPWAAVNAPHPQNRFGSGHMPYPPPWPGRKRHRALCGRLSGSCWEKATAFSDDLYLKHGSAPTEMVACKVFSASGGAQ